MKSLIILAALTSSPSEHQEHYPKRTEVAMVCTFTGQQEQSGLNRICYYNCMGSKTAITVHATDICPIQITQ